MLHKNMSFCLESTLSGKYLVRVLQSAREQGYFIRMIYVFLETPEQCIQRIEVRVRSGGHFIPPEDVRRRFYRSAKNFWDIYRPLADEWFLYYNAGDSSEPVAFSVGHDVSYTIEDELSLAIFRKILSAL